MVPIPLLPWLPNSRVIISGVFRHVALTLPPPVRFPCTTDQHCHRWQHQQNISTLRPFVFVFLFFLKGAPSHAHLWRQTRAPQLPFWTSVYRFSLSFNPWLLVETCRGWNEFPCLASPSLARRQTGSEGQSRGERHDTQHESKSFKSFKYCCLFEQQLIFISLGSTAWS